MNKIETDKIENTQNARRLRDDELDAVSGGIKYAFNDVMVES